MKTTLSPRIAVMCTASWLHRPETYFHFQHLLFRRPIFQPRAFRFDRNPPFAPYPTSMRASTINERRKDLRRKREKERIDRSKESFPRGTRGNAREGGRNSETRTREREGAGSNGFEYPPRIHLLPLSSRVTRYVAALVGPALVLKFSVTGEP